MAFHLFHSQPHIFLGRPRSLPFAQLSLFIFSFPLPLFSPCLFHFSHFPPCIYSSQPLSCSLFIYPYSLFYSDTIVYHLDPIIILQVLYLPLPLYSFFFFLIGLLTHSIASLTFLNHQSCTPIDQEVKRVQCV